MLYMNELELRLHHSFKGRFEISTGRNLSFPPAKVGGGGQGGCGINSENAWSRSANIIGIHTHTLRLQLSFNPRPSISKALSSKVSFKGPLNNKRNTRLA